MDKNKIDMQMLSEILNKLIEIENSLNIGDEREKEILLTLSDVSYGVSRAIQLIDKHS